MHYQHIYSDAELRERTRVLLEAAERVSDQLEAQNERLAAAIEMFHRDVLDPLRRGDFPDASHRY